MIVCGIDLASSEARLVTLNGTRDTFHHVANSLPKVVLPDDTQQTEVKAFRDTVHAYLREHAVSRVVIKKRNKRGGYAGGAVGFKLEGLVQLYEGCQVLLIAPQAIAAAKRNRAISAPTGLYGYQTEAFETAFAGLPEHE